MTVACNIVSKSSTITRYIPDFKLYEVLDKLGEMYYNEKLNTDGGETACVTISHNKKIYDFTISLYDARDFDKYLTKYHTLEIVKSLLIEHDFDTVYQMILSLKPSESKTTTEVLEVDKVLCKSKSTPTTNRYTYSIDQALPSSESENREIEGVNGDSSPYPPIDKETLDRDLDNIKVNIDRYHKDKVILKKLSELKEGIDYDLDFFLQNTGMTIQHIKK